jgi:stage V sporulation protein G
MRSAVAEFSVKRLVKFDGNGSVKAYCDLAVGDLFLLKGLRVVAGKKGLFVSMPRQLGKDGKWYDHVVTLADDTKDAVNRVVLDAYQQELASPA